MPSHVWSHFRLARDGEPSTDGGRVLHYCLSCPKQRAFKATFTSNAKEHLRRKHHIDVDTLDPTATPLSTGRSQSQLSLAESFRNATPTKESTLRAAFNIQAYYDAVVALITRCNVPFSIVERPEFTDLCLAIHPCVGDLLLKTRKALYPRIQYAYRLHQESLRQALRKARSMVHLSADVWTSPNHRSFMAICGHFVDESYQLRKALLGLPECKVEHTGENLASLIMAYVKDYDLADRLGYFTGDNAGNNDTCLRHLASLLEKQFKVCYSPGRRRIRCIGHIINLSLHAFLLATSKEALEAALQAMGGVDDTQSDAFLQNLYRPRPDENQQPPAQDRPQRPSKKRRRQQIEQESDFTGWAGILPLQKLHNLAIWMRASPQRFTKWIDAVGCVLKVDNATRWNSWYHVLSVAIKYRAAIAQFVDEHGDADANIHLTADGWNLLEKTYEFLGPFEQATRMTEQDSSSLGQTLKVLDILLVHYERAKGLYSSPNTYDPRMLHSINMGWYVLNKYYALTDATPAYAASVLLHPSRRKKYVEKNWPAAWHGPTIAAVQALWKEEYKDRHVDESAPQDPSTAPIPPTYSGIFSDLMDEIEVPSAEPGQVDDLASFIEADVQKLPFGVTALDWWCRAEQRNAYPRLSRMAIDIFSIPPMSAEPERIFSGARRTLSWERASLSPESLEMVEWLGHWLGNGYAMQEDSEEFKRAIMAAIIGEFEDFREFSSSSGIADADIE